MIKQFILAILLTFSAFAGVDEGIKAMNDGNYKIAYNEFLSLANSGDSKAMVTIGIMYHRGQGFNQDYKMALNWYLKAFDKFNGDAYSNIGVMFRDGLAVPKNNKIAFCLFLITHMRGLGSESTQYRANSCLRRIQQKKKKKDFIECFNYSEEYIQAFVKAKGDIEEVKKSHKTSKRYVLLKDKKWWLKGELPDYIKANK